MYYPNHQGTYNPDYLQNPNFQQAIGTDFWDAWNRKTSGANLGDQVTIGNMAFTYGNGQGSDLPYYTDSVTGETIAIDPRTPPGQLYNQSPDIAAGWDRWAEDNIQTDGFNIPTNVFSSSSSQGNQSSFGGVNWEDPYAQGLLGPVTETSQRLQGLAQEMPGHLQGYFDKLMSDAMGPGAFQGTLNNLASRGMLESSVAENALSQAGVDITRDVGDKAYQSYLGGLQAEMQVPEMLGNLINQLSRQTSSLGETGSYTEHPLEGYELMASMLRGLM